MSDTFLPLGTGFYQAPTGKPHLKEDINLTSTISAAVSGATQQVVKVADNYADDTAAAAGGIPVGGLYHNAGAVRIRLV